MDDYAVIIKILNEVFKGKNLSDAFISYTSNSIVSVAKVKDICYGLCRNIYTLEFILKQLISYNTTPSLIKHILLIALYEINYTQKPSYAITNDLVNLSFNLTKNVKMKNLVNAVIRNYLRQKEDFQSKILNNNNLNFILNNWWINKIRKYYPSNYKEIICDLNIKPSMGLRCNPQKTSLDEYQKILLNNKIEFSIIDGKIVLLNPIEISKIPFFNEGYVSVQDIGAQKLIDIIGDIPDNCSILDACCAPGGKTCQILENYNVDLLSIDINKSRIEKTLQNLKRLNLNSKLQVADATQSNWWNQKPFDLIICDVPCSASGTLKRNPDIKLNRTENDIKSFVNLQRQIVMNLWNMLKVNGKLLYITCSIFNEENQDNIKYLLTKLNYSVLLSETSITPTKFNDGFYYALLTKNE